ncbi:hypothetical protein ACPWZ5_19075 [Ralstonia pseudosolanacearum]|uniref:hypothetical protein n=1 Tax=Ralstonia pseudosolanacearum TaxID=1310165 RepID=UPI003CEE5093
MSAFIDARENGVTDKPLSRRSRGKTGSNAKIGRWPPENIQQIESQIFEILNGLDIVAPSPRYYLRAPIIGALASQARHDCCPQSPMIRGVLSPGLVGGW